MPEVWGKAGQSGQNHENKFHVSHITGLNLSELITLSCKIKFDIILIKIRSHATPD